MQHRHEAMKNNPVRHFGAQLVTTGCPLLLENSPCFSLVLFATTFLQLLPRFLRWFTNPLKLESLLHLLQSHGIGRGETLNEKPSYWNLAWLRQSARFAESIGGKHLYSDFCVLLVRRTQRSVHNRKYSEPLTCSNRFGATARPWLALVVALKGDWR